VTQAGWQANTTPAVLYAAKSTADEHGSIPTQLADGRTLAEREGMTVMAEYSDEAASAYKGDRGPGLARALAECERLGATLICQHSDRLARGDGRRAKHLVEYALWALKHDLAIRSVQDDQTFGDLLYAVVTGTRNNEDSARKSASVRDGLRRRAEKGQPVGPVPIGYVPEPLVGCDGKPVLDKSGKVVMQRVIDAATADMVETTFAMVARGSTPGTVARRLNSEGHTTRRGKRWTARAIRDLVRCASYKGEGGYDAIIDPGLWQRANDALIRLDPAAVQKRKGGTTGADAYLLRGVVFCLDCGASLYTRQYRFGRGYRCREKLQSTGVCDAPAIPAELLEGHVVDHLEAFVGSAETWLREQVHERDAGRELRVQAVDRLRADLVALDRKRSLVIADYENALTDGDPNARLVLEVAAKLDRERDGLTEQIDTAEQLVGEPGDTGVNDALDLYGHIVDAVRGNPADALAQVAGMWVGVRDGKLHAEFQLRAPDGPTSHEAAVHLLQHARPVGLEARRFTLAEPDGRPWYCVLFGRCFRYPTAACSWRQRARRAGVGQVV
jgi:DNA invertase Pin-like site-specific DNA recombinase